jgi:hypothetical protein
VTVTRMVSWAVTQCCVTASYERWYVATRIHSSTCRKLVMFKWDFTHAVKETWGMSIRIALINPTAIFSSSFDHNYIMYWQKHAVNFTIPLGVLYEVRGRKHETKKLHFICTSLEVQFFRMPLSQFTSLFGPLTSYITTINCLYMQ